VIKVAEPSVNHTEVDLVTSVLLGGRYVQGPQVKQFEFDFGEYIGSKYAVACNSGTAALHLALLALGIKEGDEVIVPPITFFATIQAVLYVRATPVFADIDPDTYCIDPQSVSDQVNWKTKAIIPVHLYGHPCDMQGLGTIAYVNDLKIIEDAAQAHGAIWQQQRVGTIGDCACWSFYATKNMTTGEGGMVTTNDLACDTSIRLLRSHGMTDRDTHAVLGYNYRMSEINAAIGLAQLRKLPYLNQCRASHAAYLTLKLQNVSWLKLPTVKPYVEHAWFWYPVWIDEDKLGMTTAELITRLKEQDIEVRHRYQEPLYKQPVIRHTFPKYQDLYLPNAEKIAGRMIGLPNHPNLTLDDLEHVTEVIQNI
jgi:dTDP-4-amino-4,6-dideoxygalactose transaminase